MFNEAANRAFSACYVDIRQVEPDMRSQFDTARAYFSHGYAEGLKAARAEQFQQPWRPYVSEPIKGVFTLGRWNPQGYRENWNPRLVRWDAFEGQAGTREQAEGLMRRLVVVTEFGVRS